MVLCMVKDSVEQGLPAINLPEKIVIGKGADSCLQCAVLLQIFLPGAFNFYDGASLACRCSFIDITEFTVCMRACIVHTKGFCSRPDAVVLWCGKMGLKNIAVF